MPLVPDAFVRPPRRVQPDVAARDDRAGEGEVVVLEEDDAAGDGGVVRELDDPLHHVLARCVLRMRLARDDDLERKREQPLEIGEDEAGALVRREAAREADGQPVGVEPGQPGEPRLERRVHVPERVRVELVDGLPTAFVGRSLGPHPDGAEQIVELGCEPGAEVDAVRDVPDLRLLARPERRPHLACDFTVQLGDGVGGGREPERERRQPEAVRPRGAAELEERVARQTRAAGEVARVAEDELVVEHLVARRHRRVRGEDRRPADALQRALGLLSGLDEPPGPLDREEGPSGPR